MGYRGDDLDLRTPQGAPSRPAQGEFVPFQPGDPFFVAPRHRPAQATASRLAPIWVDQATLDCCNHAFDVAKAHRVPEVRVEHLIYALTCNDEAVDAIEVRSIEVAGLRREVATVLAAEPPAVQGNGRSAPRRSDTLEEVLRLAAAQAYRRNEPIGVGDLVHVLFDGSIDSPMLERLLGTQARPGAGTRDIDAVRDRLRGVTAQETYASAFSTDFAGPAPAPLYAQQSRIDALEHTVRAFMSEMSNERKILSGVLQDLQRELMTHRDESSRFSTDKMQAAATDRLQSLEQAYLASRGPSSADVGALQDRLGTVERTLLAEIAAVRAAVEALAERPAPSLDGLESRIATVETALAEAQKRDAATEERLLGKLAALAESIERQPSEIAAVVAAPLIEHLNGLAVARDTQHAAVSDALADASQRIEALDTALSGHAERTESAAIRAAENFDALRDGVVRLGEAVEDQHARFTDTLTRDIADLHDALGRLDTGQQVLSSSLDTQGQDAVDAFNGLAVRIDTLERASVRPMEMLEQLSDTVEKMHKVTIEKYYRRNRFWYWLFGTDDWLAASWPSQSARIAEELRALKR